jgi:hypothetical protein
LQVYVDRLQLTPFVKLVPRCAGLVCRIETFEDGLEESHKGEDMGTLKLLGSNVPLVSTARKICHGYDDLLFFWRCETILLHMHEPGVNGALAIECWGFVSFWCTKGGVQRSMKFRFCTSQLSPCAIQLILRGLQVVSSGSELPV